MPFRSWMYVFTLGIALATSGQAQEQTEGPQGEASQKNEPSYETPLPFPVEIIEDQSASEARQRHEEESRQREIDDLIAQKGMNEATRAIKDATVDMRDYALYSTLLVGFGTFLLIVTLWLTRQANRAAREAVDVTRVIGEAQTRGYLQFKKGSFVLRTERVAVNLDNRFSLFFHNSGATPIHVRFGNATADIKCDDKVVATVEFKPVEVEKEFGGNGDDDMSFESPQNEGLVEAAKRHATKDAKVVISVSIETRDVFDKWTDFKAEIESDITFSPDDSDIKARFKHTRVTMVHRRLRGTQSQQ